MTREIYPYSQITKGEDTVSESDELIFSDFRPKVSRDELDPKDVSAPAPANSKVLPEEEPVQVPEKTVQVAADAEDLKDNLEETSKPTGSSDQKSG